MRNLTLFKKKFLISYLFLFLLVISTNSSSVTSISTESFLKLRGLGCAGVCSSCLESAEESLPQCTSNEHRYNYITSRFPKSIATSHSGREIVEGCSLSGPCWSCLAGTFFQIDSHGIPRCVQAEYSLQETTQPESCNDKEGNPCSPATGVKSQLFIDYASNTQGLVFKRAYLSQTNTINQFVSGWQHNFSSVMNPAPEAVNLISLDSNIAGINNSGLQQSSAHPNAEEACLNGWQEIKNKAFRGILSSEQVQYAGGNLCHVLNGGVIVATLTIHSSGQAGFDTPLITLTHRIIHSNGSQYLFQQQGAKWIDIQHPEASLIAQGTNWLLTDTEDNQELYDDQGRLIKMTNRQGQVTFLQHDLTTAEGGDDKPETLDKVTDPFGRTLVFNYHTSNGKLISVNTPDGLVQYEYDTFENLTQVTHPDGKTEIYHYEKTTFPHHLTGITDEKGNRFATWDYDNQGRAVLSEHAGQADKVTFAYNSDGTTTVTGALGDTRTYHFDWIKGGLKVKKITGDRCQTCGNGHMKERTYDSNGYLSSYTDWNGSLTTYTRDATGLELSRTEASGTPQARTITTDWHADFRLPVKVTQSGKVTEYNYDALGHLLSQTTRNAQ